MSGTADERRRRATPTGIDAVQWAQTHARLEDAARGADAAASALDPEQADLLLRERARALARPLGASDVAPTLEVLRVGIGGRALAVETRHLHAVLRDVAPTPLPGAAAPVSALVPWRGRILTALDLRAPLGIPATADDAARHLLVLGDALPELGLLVDEVHALESLDPARLHPLPDGAAARREYVAGLTDDALLLLDAAALLRLHAADA